jgi:D-alanyl-lipoteichoic acid acyltransferase DltB (MBOAT superfamily)
MGLILVGLLRKLIVADGLAAIRPSDIFSQPAGYSIIEHIVWLVVFAFVLYNDFAGYTSIVRGISALMGFELTANFSQPFFANSFSDFWNRWHISLSAWLRDYIFFPVRRWSMKKRFPNWVTLVVPPMITMVASGYWHGATFSMLAWGGLHGIYQVVDQKFRKTASLSSATRQGFSIALVFIFVTIAWIPFAAISFLDAVAYMRVFLPPYGLEFPTPVLINLIAALSISLALDLKEYKASSELYFLDWSPSFQAWAVSFALLILLLFAGGGPDISNFIYQGF